MGSSITCEIQHLSIKYISSRFSRLDTMSSDIPSYAWNEGGDASQQHMKIYQHASETD